MHDNTRLRAAIDRTFAEVNNALLKLAAYNALCREDVTYARMSFFVVVEQALHNDMVANAMRALDQHRDAASFWYIVRCNQDASDRVANEAGIQLPAIQATSTKLKHVREKTHFHVDRDAVAEPSAVWQAAGITGNELIGALRGVASIVSRLKVEVFGGEPLELAEYDASDVRLILRAYEDRHGHVHGV